jgi:hypothetical protein
VSTSRNLLLGGGSSGLCSSRIDLVRDSRLNGFGLLFRVVLLVFEDDEGGDDSADSTGLSGFEEDPPTGRLVTARSAESVETIRISS